MSTLLEIKDLHVSFGRGDKEVKAVCGASLDIQKGETVALVGESGSGKSVTALSIMQLLPYPTAHHPAGNITFQGEQLIGAPGSTLRKIRGNRIAMIFQEPQTSLNPVISIGDQIRETVYQHTELRNDAAHKRVLELLDAVGIPAPIKRYAEYPHQLSGGMKQRIMIAIALAAEPDVLIADEPTTALDVTIQAQVLDLLKALQKKTGMAILLITHDLGVVSGMADRVAVMYAGQIVEQASRDEFFARPRHPYSEKLFASLPGDMKRGQRLAVIHGSVPPLYKTFSGCRFVERCDYAWDACHTTPPSWQEDGIRCHRYERGVCIHDEASSTDFESEPVQAALTSDDELLNITDLKIHFPVHKGFLRRVTGYVKAVDGLSLRIKQGRTLALVGESGCGKTTAGKGLLRLLPITAGHVEYKGMDLAKLEAKQIRKLRSDLQIIFQDPYASMNPRMLVGDIIAEGMLAQSIPGNREEAIKALLGKVGLPADSMQRYPHEFSGGQRQRICIARALAVKPKLIVCDEPTSALDVSVQAQILNLLQSLQAESGLSYLFITHNISVVEYLAHDVAVMYLGRIVEQGSVAEVLHSPKHPYTQALLSAVPVIDKESLREVIHLEGDMPSPLNPPQGCHFHPRCIHAKPACREDYPTNIDFSDSHQVACHLYATT